MNVHGGHLLPRFDWDLGIGVRREGGVILFSLQAERLRKGFREVLASCRDEALCMEDIVEKLMCDKTKAERDMLPMTGCSPELELEFSSIFIETHRKQVTNQIYYCFVTALEHLIQSFQFVFRHRHRDFMERETWVRYRLKQAVRLASTR
ncbi:hypothetical protein B296_00039675, partial [Ensete ventricosum]